MHTLKITCPRCSRENIKKNGTTRNGKQKYLCLLCRRQFILDYSYRGYLPFLRDLIVPMTLNGSGVRDIARVLKLSVNTVLKVIRERAEQTAEPKPPARLADVEVDELWSFVQKKQQQAWLWYAYSPRLQKIIGFVIGRRTDQSCQRLLAKLRECQVTRFFTDDWESYEKLIPEYRHWVGKMGTQRIERQNLNFRTHLKRLHRRTICFSKSLEMHEAVIRLYINHLNLGQHKL